MGNSNHTVSRTDVWQQHVNAWQQTDQSGAAFCQEQGLVYHQFVYWRQKLLKAGADSPKPEPPRGFTHIRYQPEEDAGLTVLLPSGIEIRGIHAGNVSAAQLLLASL